MQNGHVVNWPRIVLAALDVALLNLGLLVAFWLRYEDWGPHDVVASYYPQAFYGSLLAVGVFYLFGLYNRIWIHASTEALAAVVGAATAAIIAFALFVWIVAPVRLPHTVCVLTWLLWIALVGGSRFLWRFIRETALSATETTSASPNTKRIIVYGAGSAGAMLVRQLEQGNGDTYDVVGLVDDDPFKRGMLVLRKRVLGTGEELAALVRRHQVDEVIVAIPSASGEELRYVVQCCLDAAVPYRILPSVLEIGGAPVQVEDAREVDIADLLGRSPAEFPVETYGEYLRGRAVLVTGAGGSIGSEICRQVARFAPRQLVLVGRGENRIHAILRELRNAHSHLNIVPAIANVAATEAVRDLFAAHSPDIVIHAAAHKHVYLMEQHPTEAARNNVLGTDNLTELAMASGVKRFIMISTDKAVDPTSVMGASKLAGETICQVRQTCSRNNGTIFATVRFGNVLGSAGSVLTIFRKQLQARQPLTITHPDATRYFMTIPEAALLVLQSGGISHGGETYVLDMGEPVRIRDLAAQLIALSGGDPDDPRNYRYIGMAPGEKLHERLWAQDERVTRVTDHILQVACSEVGPAEAELDSWLEVLRQTVVQGDAEAVRGMLFERLGRAERTPELEESSPSDR